MVEAAEVSEVIDNLERQGFILIPPRMQVVDDGPTVSFVRNKPSPERLVTIADRLSRDIEDKIDEDDPESPLTRSFLYLNTAIEYLRKHVEEKASK